MENRIKIPVYKPYLAGNEKKYVIDCMDTSWISSKGKYVPIFEKKFADYIGTKYAASVSNGTVAIHLALVALGIGPGDEVIVPTLTYIATVNPVLYVGATPVFVDSCQDDWQMNPDDILNKITSRTKAIIAVHLYGHPCEMQQIVEIAEKKQLFLIEDCAEALGTRYNRQHVGSFGNLSTFSFFGNKTITTGEGGMVVTNDNTLHDRVLHYKGQGLAKYREYWHDVIGYNYRMTNICAAIGTAQLEKVDEIIGKKRQLANWYQKELKDLPVVFHMEKENVFHSYWMCTILVKKASDRDPLRLKLKEDGIETRPVFYPIHTMPMYSSKFQRHPVAENIGWRGINLPSYPEIRNRDIIYICDCIRQYFK